MGRGTFFNIFTSICGMELKYFHDGKWKNLYHSRQIKNVWEIVCLSSFIVEKRLTFNELNKVLKGKFKLLLDMFSGLNVFEAIMNLPHKHTIERISAILQLAKPFQNLSPHKVNSRRWKTWCLVEFDSSKISCSHYSAIFTNG